MIYLIYILSLVLLIPCACRFFVLHLAIVRYLAKDYRLRTLYEMQQNNRDLLEIALMGGAMAFLAVIHLGILVC